MKALKTVAIALGVTLAALIVIPLVVLVGLFVWLAIFAVPGSPGAGCHGDPGLAR